MEFSVNLSLVSLGCVASGLFCRERILKKAPQQLKENNNKAVWENPQLTRLRWTFLSANLLALLADWLQGPYVHRLYSYHGHNEGDIALLFLAGYLSSCVFGSLTGPLADKYGRKLMAQVFCAVYAVCCLTKLSPNFWVLLAGRVFSGVSTSCLYSVFESWYVCEHKKQNINFDDIRGTLSMLTVGNSLLAIIAGLGAELFVSGLDFGPVAPFIISLPILLLSCTIIGVFWKENYGERTCDLSETYSQGLQIVWGNPAIWKLGWIQALVEACMFIFVYLWTPTLTNGPGYVPLGKVFACFMMAIMIGSFCFRTLSKNMSSEFLLCLACTLFFIATLAAALFSGGNYSEHYRHHSLAAFFLIEFSLGIYFPSIGTLRSKVIPESHRSTIINLFRVPLNIITVTLLYMVKSGHLVDRQIIFLCTSMFLSIALCIALKINRT